jgi:SAM-dependent methyltransferase
MRKINLKNEKSFENRKYLGLDIRIAQSKYYWATQIPTDAHKTATLSKITNKKVLEIGCSSGYDAKIYADHVKSFIGVDISNEAISIAQGWNLKNSEFFCIDGHNLPVPDFSIDCVIVSSLLHHLDLDQSLSEISRVLKDDGILIFREPLGTNPFFKMYRFFSPSARTADERPFTFNDLSLMNKYFTLNDVRWFGFTNIISAFTKSQQLRAFLTDFDELLSKTQLKFLFWQFAGFAKKKSFFVIMESNNVELPNLSTNYLLRKL